MAQIGSHIREDEDGVRRVGNSRVMLDSIVAAFQQGFCAETIAQQYPALLLEEVYGAITYYLANREIVDQYLQQQDRLWKAERAKADQIPIAVVQRIRNQFVRGDTDAP